MAKKIEKKVVAKKAVEAKVKKVSAASIVLGMFNLKVVPSDLEIINAVQEACEGSKFDKTHLAWYKYQFRQGRWNEGEPQVIRQEEKPKAEKAEKAAPKKLAKKVKKAVKPDIADEEEVESED